ncbi:hypothetical protein UlMin_041305 [Ulmus minor]
MDEIQNLRQQLLLQGGEGIGGNGGNPTDTETYDSHTRSGSNRPPFRHGFEREPLYARFGKMKPTEFAGSTDPLEAEEWLSSIETILDFMRLTDQERVSCASFMLKKDARHWWATVKVTRDVTEMTWADFVREFNQKYYNSAILRAQQDEFMNLKQGNMTVIEAVNKFEQLSRVCPHMLRTEEDRLKRMMDMFKPDIALAIESGGIPPTTVARCVERAVRIEYRMAQVKEERNKYFEAKRSQRKVGTEVQEGFQQGFETRCRINRIRELIPRVFRTSLPSGDVLISTHWLRAIPVLVSDRELYVDLIMLDLHDYDVILGMDFLSNGCQGYLATVVDTTHEEKLKPEKIAVVREFPDVFPEDLPGIPPEREISFEIELLPGSAPVSKAPYRMAPAELKELQIQL